LILYSQKTAIVNCAVLHYCFFALIAKKDYLPTQVPNTAVTAVEKSNPFPGKSGDQESIAGSLTTLITRGLNEEVAATGDPVRKAEKLIRKLTRRKRKWMFLLPLAKEAV